jgi:TusA-related sulfurtransferase
MPGTAIMARRKALIHYAYGELPRGAEVRITTSDPESRAAIAQFLQAQRTEHHATGN